MSNLNDARKALLQATPSVVTPGYHLIASGSLAIIQAYLDAQVPLIIEMQKAHAAIGKALFGDQPAHRYTSLYDPAFTGKLTADAMSALREMIRPPSSEFAAPYGGNSPTMVIIDDPLNADGRQPPRSSMGANGNPNICWSHLGQPCQCIACRARGHA